MEADKIEPFHPRDDSELIFAENQNQSGFINPKFVKPLDEQGNPLERRPPKQSLIISHYWIKKKKQIAALGAISCLALSSILVQETQIFDSFFQILVGFIGTIIGLVLGAFF